MTLAFNNVCFILLNFKISCPIILVLNDKDKIHCFTAMATRELKNGSGGKSTTSNIIFLLILKYAISNNFMLKLQKHLK